MKGPILIADDEESLLGLAKRFLEGLERPIELFKDPFLVLQRLQDQTQEKVALVITDFDFGQEINGVDIAKFARKSGVECVLLHSSRPAAIPDTEKLKEKGILVAMKQLNFQFKKFVEGLLENKTD